MTAIKIGSFNIGISTTVFSLIVALLSVLASTAPTLKETFGSKNADMNFTFHGASEDYIAILVHNSGSRPGTFREAMLFGGTALAAQLEIRPNPVPEFAKIVEPGKVEIIHVRSKDTIPEDTNVDGTCWLTVDFTDFLGHALSKRQDVDCIQLGHLYLINQSEESGLPTQCRISFTSCCEVVPVV